MYMDNLQFDDKQIEEEKTFESPPPPLQTVLHPIFYKGDLRKSLGRFSSHVAQGYYMRRICVQKVVDELVQGQISKVTEL